MPLAGVERGEAAGAYAKRNPPDKKYAKKQLFDVLNYMKVRFATTQSVDRDEDKPMTRQAFDKYCEREHGLEPCEVESWWQELYDNPRVERDQKGFRGESNCGCRLDQHDSATALEESRTP